jgi:hypothetical protein
MCTGVAGGGGVLEVCAAGATEPLELLELLDVEAEVFLSDDGPEEPLQPLATSATPATSTATRRALGPDFDETTPPR